MLGLGEMRSYAPEELQEEMMMLRHPQEHGEVLPISNQKKEKDNAMLIYHFLLFEIII